MKYITRNKGEKGFALVYAAVLVLAMIITTAISIAALTYNEQIILKNVIKSTQAYYAAEAGAEDALLRLKNNMSLSPDPLNIGGGTAEIEISDILGGSRTIISNGDISNRIRKIRVIYQVSFEEVSFYYGAQIGDGGMEMGNNAIVKGNIFSNGSVISTQRGYIDNTIKVATIGSSIEGLIVGENAYTHNCKDSTIAKILYYSGGNLQSCNATEGVKEHPIQEGKDFPIAQTQIDEWKTEASCSDSPECIIEGDYVLDGGETDYLGLKKITGSMTLDNNSTLIITSTIWVVGDITIRNGASVKLDLNSYGELSGILVADGKIHIKPGVTLEGSGREGSYLLIISTNDSLDDKNPAIDIDNTTSGGIFYTPNTYDTRNGGLIVIRNRVEAREVTGYKVFLEEGAVIDYDYGLEDAEFSSGPGGSWKVISWKEVE